MAYYKSISHFNFIGKVLEKIKFKLLTNVLNTEQQKIFCMHEKTIQQRLLS